MAVEPSRVQNAFLEIVESSDPAGYVAALDRLCAGDEDLRSRVADLLDAHHQSAALLDRPIVGREGHAVWPFGGSSDEAPADETETRRGGVAVTSGPPLDPRHAAFSWAGDPWENPDRPFPAIPDYEIVRELGRGGMGVVFEARQISLNRTVALKMIRVGVLAGEDELRRFRNEAQAVALLEHPGIIPVYEVGEHGGQPYFSMRLIPEGSLAACLPRYMGDPKAVARLLAEAADAVAHAHARGILHRDLKPANILVDHEGRPYITDFGLAKRIGDGADSTDTATGAVLGSPGYMAPEQATGPRRGLTTATDVYGLGAVLYALLTGRPPFAGESLFVTLDSLLTRPPASPATLNASVPRDLETICLKCLEKDPRGRYPSAQALADDLRAWLGARPIAARRTAVPTRAWLWCKRQPVVAALIATVALCLVGGTATLIAVQAAANRTLAARNADLTAALGREAQARTELATAGRRVEQQYDLAMGAIRSFHTGVSKDFLLRQQEFKPLRDRLLNSAADFYGKLGALLDREADLASRRRLLRANFELASLNADVGRTEDALAAHRAVLDRRRAMAAAPGAAPGVRVEVGRSLMAVAGLLRSRGETSRALTTYRDAERLLADHPTQGPEAAAALAVCRSSLAALLSVMGKVDEALAACRQARTVQESLAAAPGASAAARNDLANTIGQMGILLTRAGRTAEAEAEYRAAVAIYRELADLDPADTVVRANAAVSRTNRAYVLSLMGRAAEAEAEYRAVLAIYRELVASNPAVVAFRHRSAGCHNNLAHVLLLTGRPTEAEAEYRAAVAIYRTLVDEHPSVADYRSRLAGGFNNLGEVFLGMSRAADAEVAYREAAAIREELTAHYPDNPAYREGLANVQTGLAGALRRLGRTTEARATFDRAIATREALAREAPRSAARARGLASDLWRRGLCRRDQGDHAGAATDFRRTIGLRHAQPSGSGEDAFEDACCHAALASLAGAACSDVSPEQARSSAETAMIRLRRAVAMGYRNADAFRTEDSLDPLRGRDDFRLLQLDLAFPADPFARTP